MSSSLFNMEKFINQIICVDAIEGISNLPDNSINLILTSPPYFNCRVYGNETIGREEDPREYVSNILNYVNDLKRVMHKEGSFYLNVGDVYFGTKGFSRNKGNYARKTDNHYAEYKIIKPDGAYLQYKQLLMLPERIAIGMQDSGWILRNKIIWEKTNPVPSHSKDRRYPVYEHVFHFVKSKKYYFDLEKAKQLKHHRDVIKTNVRAFKNSHQASFPLDLIQPLIETTSKVGDIVLDPFMGSGTTAEACINLNRNYIGFDINKEYCKIARNRIKSINVYKETV